MTEAYCITAADLAALGKENIPPQLVSSTHLIYSSPATLSFNSPGAQGFGVKRAGLAVPGSVMLLVAPGCCGRNTSTLIEEQYANRFFYLMMDETDVVTGRHLKKIPQAVEEIYRFLDEKPSVVMICITCVDALLGTDMERVCRRAMERVPVPVLPCYMYALTREGRKPPMVHVRQSIYSLLQPREKRSTTVNLLGYFAPLVEDCELYSLLNSVGIRRVQEISTCRDYEEYLRMAEANFNLILNPEARFAAQDMQKKLNIPSIELTRLYQLDKVKKQYALFGSAIGVTFDDQKEYDRAAAALEAFRGAYPNVTFAVGEAMNGNPFELSLALIRYGFPVREIYGNLTPEDFVYIRKIAQHSPETKIYSNLEPSMLNYGEGEQTVDLTIGSDAKWYHPDAVHVTWDEDRQPFGYKGVELLFQALKTAMDRSGRTPPAGKGTDA